MGGKEEYIKGNAETVDTPNSIWSAWNPNRTFCATSRPLVHHSYPEPK